ncbi:DoxX-like family protein [Aliikangiella maris]|uniref:DoxX-like family protein n=2 Tax=Aliikangiella maris TaxID=3162458 RepID=A0ABV3MMG2_9GAMM
MSKVPSICFKKYHFLIRITLAAVWIWTALTSLFFDFQFGFKLLKDFGVSSNYSLSLIYLASTMNLIFGLWLISGKKLLLNCHLQMITIILYTLLLSIISPDFWLHPFGPLTKNFPMLLLIILFRDKLIQVSNQKQSNG